MHQTYELQSITSLKISLKSKDSIGTGRDGGLEIIPYTDYARKRFCPEIRPLSTPPPGEVAEEFLHDLRPYQQDNVRRLIMRKSSANLSHPRTGKTPVALRLFKAKGLKKFIVVTIASALYQWKDEVTRWYGGTACVINSTLTTKQRLQALERWGQDYEVIIISYDMLKLVVSNGETRGLLPIIKKQKDVDGIIVDEIHHTRHHRTAQALAVFALSYIPVKHVLTGTPAHNKPEDAYSILHFLYPSVFTGYWRFIYYYFEVETQRFRNGPSFEKPTKLKNDIELPSFIQQISVQNKQKEVMPWLPEVNRINIKLPATKEQRTYIDALEKNYEVEHIIVENILTQLIRVRQITAAPELLQLKGSSPKMDWLKDYINDHPEESIIVFSNFTSFLDLISERLKLPNMIVGRTPNPQREVVRKAFQAGKIKVLLINIQAGKEALTLDKADTAIFLDIYPPYGDIEQAENRFTKTQKGVGKGSSSLVRIMIEDTYDEALYKLVDARASETAVINDYKQHLGGGKM